MNRDEFYNQKIRPIVEKIEDEIGIKVTASVNGKEVTARLITWGLQPNGDVIKKGALKQFPHKIP